jgi:hypothetical protein
MAFNCSADSAIWLAKRLIRQDLAEIAVRAVVWASTTTMAAISLATPPGPISCYLAATTNPRMIASTSEDCVTASSARLVIVS